MKGFAIVLLCFVAVQARYTGELSQSRAGVPAQSGENPWVVHLRIATGTSGFLSTCVGSLVAERWVLTSASCVLDARYVWVRYGGVNVVNPELVTETGTTVTHPNWNPWSGANDIALVSINRVVQSTANIQQIALASDVSIDSGRVCAWGSLEDSDAPGETLACSDVNVSSNGELLQTDIEATRFDGGAPLVANGVQYGVLVNPSTGDFLPTAPYVSWINSVVN